MGAQVAPASRTDRAAHDDVSRRHYRGDPPGPGGVVQSTITMLCYGARTGYPHPRPEWYRTTGPTASGGCSTPPSTIRPCCQRGEHRRASPRVHGRRDGHPSAHLRFGGYRVHRGARRDRGLIGPSIPGARRARSSTTYGPTSPSPQGRSVPVRRYLDRSIRSSHVSIQEQRLTDRHPPGKELLTPAYDDPARPSSTTSSTDREAPPRRTWSSPMRVRGDRQYRYGLRGPSPQAVFDAIRPGPTHHVITTQGHVDHVGGVDLFPGRRTTYIAQTQHAACQATMPSPGSGRERRGSGSTRSVSTASGSPGRTPAFRCASHSRCPI